MTPDQRKLLRALSTRGEYAKTYNPAAPYMPRPENTLLARMARHGLPEESSGGAPQAGQQRPGAWGLLGPVVAPNLTAKLGAKGG